MKKRVPGNKTNHFFTRISWHRNNEYKKRLCLEMSERPIEVGDSHMVKGVSKRVVVVKSPDPRIFEQAIFIIREDFAGQAGMSDKDVFREARRAANHYIGGRRCAPRNALSGIKAPLYAAAGAAATGLAWIAVQVTHL